MHFFYNNISYVVLVFVCNSIQCLHMTPHSGCRDTIRCCPCPSTVATGDIFSEWRNMISSLNRKSILQKTACINNRTLLIRNVGMVMHLFLLIKCFGLQSSFPSVRKKLIIPPHNDYSIFFVINFY